MILRAYKTEITVNNKQQTLLLQHMEGVQARIERRKKRNYEKEDAE